MINKFILADLFLHWSNNQKVLWNEFVPFIEQFDICFKWSGIAVQQSHGFKMIDEKN